MKKIILIALFFSSLLIANNLPQAKIISTTDCNGINLHVNFATDSNEIENDSFQKIKDFADFMNSNTSKSAEITGYTDNRASDSYNLALSQRRAEAVYNQLIAYDVDANRLTHSGYGEDSPVASNDTKTGRRANRRIEANLY